MGVRAVLTAEWFGVSGREQGADPQTAIVWYRPPRPYRVVEVEGTLAGIGKLAKHALPTRRVAHKS